MFVSFACVTSKYKKASSTPLNEVVAKLLTAGNDDIDSLINVYI